MRPRISREDLEFLPIGLAVLTAPLWIKGVAYLVCVYAGVL